MNDCPHYEPPPERGIYAASPHAWSLTSKRRKRRAPVREFGLRIVSGSFPRQEKEQPLDDCVCSASTLSNPELGFAKGRRTILPLPGGEGRSEGERLSNFLAALLVLLFCIAFSHAAEYPTTTDGDHVIRDFRFQSGETLPEVRMHYRTLGSPRRDTQGIVRNAVLILHGTTGSSAQFLRAEFAGELFGPGQLLDASRYFIVIPDNLGHGQSSKPSDGLRAKFPNYGYRDMIEAQRRLLTDGLGVNHLRLIIGTSMGGMHSWLWGQMHPDFMDALMPLASLPTQISGRNRVWRRLIIDAIRTDPEWLDGNYEKTPRGLRVALEMSWLMGNNPIQRLKEAPTFAASDEVLEKYLADRLLKVDANDYLYAFEASHDYDPGPGLEKIKAPLLAINFADDLINPPELGVLESEIKRVKRGKAVLIPLGEQTRGHGTHTLVPVWEKHLAKFLKQTETRANRLRAELPGEFMDDSPPTSRLTVPGLSEQSLVVGLLADAFPTSPKQKERSP